MKHLPSWVREWHVLTVTFLLLLALALGGMFALEATAPHPTATFTPIQLPTL